MLIADQDVQRALARVSQITSSLCELPAVPTLDWLDRAASCIARAADSGVVVIALASADEQGLLSTRDAVGVAASRDRSPAEEAALTSLRSRAHRLQGSALPFRVPSSRDVLLGRMDKLQANWKEGPMGRLWNGHVRGDLICAVAPMSYGPNQAILVCLDATTSGVDPAALMAAVMPLLVRFTSECLGPTFDNPRNWLTPREQEVLDQVALGRSVRQIAETLGRSPHTVHDHVKALHRKLGANTRGELIARALGHLARGVSAEHEGLAPREIAEGGLPAPRGGARTLV